MGIPAGNSYVRIPRSKSATMRVLLETVQRGSRYCTGGVIPIEKALRLADKFAHDRCQSVETCLEQGTWTREQYTDHVPGQ